MKKNRYGSQPLVPALGRSRSDEIGVQVSQRVDEPTMAIDSPVAATASACGPPADRSATGDQCNFVCGPQRLPMADAAQGFSELEYGVRYLLAVAERRDVGENSRRPPRESPQGGRQEVDSHRGHHR